METGDFLTYTPPASLRSSTPLINEGGGKKLPAKLQSLQYAERIIATSRESPMVCQ